MNGVVAVRRTMKELVDGTIRLQVDIDPAHRKQFLELFQEIDMPLALAPLNIAAAPPSKLPKHHKPQQLSQYAAMLCAETAFQDYLADVYMYDWEEAGKASEDPQERAAECLRHITEVASRAEYDRDTDAAARFHEVREGFREFMQAAA